MQAKATVIYNLMQLTQSLNQLGVEIEKKHGEGLLKEQPMVVRADGNRMAMAQIGHLRAVERARHSVQHAVVTRSSVFGKQSLARARSENAERDVLFLLFIGCCISVILIYYSFSIVDISDDEGADQLLM